MMLRFFVSYSHSLITDSRSYQLSQQTCEISGMTAGTMRSDQFKRLLQLIDLCPEPGGDTHQVRAVSTYFSMLGLVRTLLGWGFPSVAQRIELERGGCTHVAAMVLDRRIAYNRMLKAQQTGM